MDNEDLIELATKKYHAHCKREGLVFQQPDPHESEVEGNVIILKNVNGEFARYEVSELDRDSPRLTLVQ